MRSATLRWAQSTNSAARSGESSNILKGTLGRSDRASDTPTLTRAFALDTRPRHSPYTFIANERGMADEPWWDGQAVYATMLRDPRHRTVSQYLHLRRYADAFLQVRVQTRPACA